MTSERAKDVMELLREEAGAGTISPEMHAVSTAVGTSTTSPDNNADTIDFERLGSCAGPLPAVLPDTAAAGSGADDDHDRAPDGSGAPDSGDLHPDHDAPDHTVPDHVAPDASAAGEEVPAEVGEEVAVMTHEQLLPMAMGSGGAASAYAEAEQLPRRVVVTPAMRTGDVHRLPIFVQTSAMTANQCGFCGTRTTSGCWRRGWEVADGAFCNLCNKCGLRHKSGKLPDVPPPPATALRAGSGSRSTRNSGGTEDSGNGGAVVSGLGGGATAITPHQAHILGAGAAVTAALDDAAVAAAVAAVAAAAGEGLTGDGAGQTLGATAAGGSGRASGVAGGDQMMLIGSGLGVTNGKRPALLAVDQSKEAVAVKGRSRGVKRAAYGQFLEEASGVGGVSGGAMAAAKPRRRARGGRGGGGRQGVQLTDDDVATALLQLNSGAQPNHRRGSSGAPRSSAAHANHQQQHPPTSGSGGGGSGGRSFFFKTLVEEFGDVVRRTVGPADAAGASLTSPGVPTSLQLLRALPMSQPAGHLPGGDSLAAAVSAAAASVAAGDAAHMQLLATFMAAGDVNTAASALQYLPEQPLHESSIFLGPAEGASGGAAGQRGQAQQQAIPGIPYLPKTAGPSDAADLLPVNAAAAAGHGNGSGSGGNAAHQLHAVLQPRGAEAPGESSCVEGAQAASGRYPAASHDALAAATRQHVVAAAVAGRDEEQQQVPGGSRGSEGAADGGQSAWVRVTGGGLVDRAANHHQQNHQEHDHPQPKTEPDKQQEWQQAVAVVAPGTISQQQQVQEAAGGAEPGQTAVPPMPPPAQAQQQRQRALLTPDRIAAWLHSAGCPEAAAAFRHHGVDRTCLAGLLRILAGAGGPGKLYDVLGDFGVREPAARVRAVEQMARLQLPGA